MLIFIVFSFKFEIWVSCTLTVAVTVLDGQDSFFLAVGRGQTP